ncbi:MAG TPA: FtsQ-type POTRA domain-containing protein [Pyrinomonadaceae bacterium]|nr:FtsQ-type POTRA domain-containing protein [Pyrinomonadaceae bacterium]
MKEQVITPRAGRGPKNRGEQQRPAQRRNKSAGSSNSGGPGRRAALAYFPSAFKVALAVAVGLLVFFAYRSAASASFFDLKTVDVEGARRASRDDIAAAVRSAARAGVWRTDLDRVAAGVRELPWVREVVVARVLPSGLRVRVTEREPRLIARNAAGRLVWVDDDGVALGAAQADGEEFIVRGVEDERTEAALKRNRERVALALGLAREWRAAGLSGRVSEVNLGDLQDIRVQLAGDDSKVEVRLGSSPENFGKALAELDAKRAEPFGELIEYVNASKSLKRIIIGYPTWVNASAVAGAGAGAAAPAAAAPVPKPPTGGQNGAAVRTPAPAAPKPQAVARPAAPRAAASPAAVRQRRETPSPRPDVAGRPRRVE